MKIFAVLLAVPAVTAQSGEQSAASPAISKVRIVGKPHGAAIFLGLETKPFYT